MSKRNEKPEHAKNDFQNAIKRNLRTWVEWRTMLNDQLVDAVIAGSNLPGDIESIEKYMNRSASDPDHPTTNPKTLLSYSACPDSSTSLRRRCFYKYGIPRVRLNPNKSTLTYDAAVGRGYGSTSSVGSELSSGRNSQQSSPSSLSDDALDYFYYEGPKTFGKGNQTRGNKW